MTPHRHTSSVCRDDEHGSVTLWAVLASLCMVLVLGLAVDLSGQVTAEQRARSVAFEAARTAGQQLQLDPLATTGAVTADPDRAAAAAQSYLTAVGYSGTATIAQTTITVTVAASYPCRFLTLVGIGHLPVTGTAQVEIHRVLQGAPR